MTSNDLMTSGAGSQLSSPACVALIFTVPGSPVSVRTLPLRVAGPEMYSKETGRFDVAVASRVIGPLMVSCFGMSGMLIY